MIQVEIELLTNNCVKPFQKFDSLPFIKLCKLYATHSIAEHGLGFLITISDIEKGNKKLIKKIIFDTGGPNKTFLHNLDVRKYKLQDLDTIALSHWHYDHTGGLYDILMRARRNVEIITHSAAKFERFFNRSNEIDMKTIHGKKRDHIIKYLKKSKIVNQEPINESLIETFNGKLKYCKYNYSIFKNEEIKLILTGEIPRNHLDEDFSNYYSIQNEGIFREDKIWDDKCLIIEYKDFVILLIGCCHSGIKNTIDYVKNQTRKPIKFIIGGFHMANASKKRIMSTIEYLKRSIYLKNNHFFFPIHCTGDKFFQSIKKKQIHNIHIINVGVGTKFVFSSKKNV